MNIEKPVLVFVGIIIMCLAFTVMDFFLYINTLSRRNQILEAQLNLCIQDKEAKHEGSKSRNF